MLAHRVLVEDRIGHVICRQIAVVTLALGCAGNVQHAGEGAQVVFDFTEFDAETAYLDLRIVTPEKFNRAIRQKAPQIAGHVHQRIGRAAERIDHEAFQCQIVAVKIAARQATAANADFAHSAHRHRLFVGVEQVEPITGNGFANYPRVSIREDDSARGHDSCFGRAVEAEQPRLARPPVGRLLVNRIAAKANHFQAG